jgi:hypothetical protein
MRERPVTPEEATTAVIDALNTLAIPYMLVGSLSSSYYGIARSTQDADFVVQLGAGTLSALTARLGPRFRLDPQMSFETVTATRRYILSVVENPFKIELFLLSDDPHDQERFVRRRRQPALSRDVYLPAAEDVIVTKLRWSHYGRRTKDIDDVRNVIAVQADRIDWAYVTAWCDRHGTRELLDRIRQEQLAE